MIFQKRKWIVATYYKINVQLSNESKSELEPDNISKDVQLSGLSLSYLAYPDSYLAAAVPHLAPVATLSFLWAWPHNESESVVM